MIRLLKVQGYANKIKVLQWFWFGTSADQTYESCVDMVVVDSVPQTASAKTSGAATNTGIKDAAAALKSLSRFRIRV